MKAKVEIVFAAPSQNFNLEVELKGSPKGQRLMNAVEKAVEAEMAKRCVDNATMNNWKRWNLLAVKP